MICFLLCELRLIDDSGLLIGRRIKVSLLIPMPALLVGLHIFILSHKRVYVPKSINPPTFKTKPSLYLATAVIIKSFLSIVFYPLNLPLLA